VAEGSLVNPTVPVSPASRPRRRGLATLIAVIGVVIASTLIWNASNAAFTATTTNGSNSFSAGTVGLTDNDSNGVLFNVGSLKPGATGSACLRVTYNGSLASAVKLYASSPSATASLDTYITLKVEEGAFASVPAFPACTSFVAAGAPISNGPLSTFTTNSTSYATGVGTWAPNGAAQTKDYQFTYTLSSAAPDSVQGATASLTLVWEAQNS